MRRAGFLTMLIAAVIAASAVASHAGTACRAESDIVESYHHMLGRAVGPWLAAVQPKEFLQWSDWLPDAARDVCDFMRAGRNIDLVADAPVAIGDELQEGRAADQPTQ